MSALPLRNGKGVNKPFRSPFSNIARPQKNDEKYTPNTSQSDSRKIRPKAATSKQLLFEQSSSLGKVPRLTENLGRPKNTINDGVLRYSDLGMLRKRVKEKQRSIDQIKAGLRNKQKNKAEDIEADIEKWTCACQTVLMDYHADLQMGYDPSAKMVDILASLHIDHGLVRFTANDESFH